MSRLICLDLCVGRKVVVRGTEFWIRRLSRTPPRVLLESGTATPKKLLLTTDELVSLLVKEEAELCDELEDPEPTRARTREATDIAGLAPHRLIDWQVKLFLHRWMAPHRAGGPESKAFKEAYAEGQELLTSWYAAIGLIEVPMPTAWSVYQRLLAWRRSKYTYQALQVKGLDYSPWKKRNPFYEAVRKLITEEKLKQPSLSAAAIYDIVLKKVRQASPTGAAGQDAASQSR
jgi:hypothetical protein